MENNLVEGKLGSQCAQGKKVGEGKKTTMEVGIRNLKIWETDPWATCRLGLLRKGPGN